MSYNGKKGEKNIRDALASPKYMFRCSKCVFRIVDTYILANTKKMNEKYFFILEIFDFEIFEIL